MCRLFSARENRRESDRKSTSWEMKSTYRRGSECRTLGQDLSSRNAKRRPIGRRFATRARMKMEARETELILRKLPSLVGLRLERSPDFFGSTPGRTPTVVGVTSAL